MNINMMGNRVSINGSWFYGRNVQVNDGNVCIDGKSILITQGPISLIVEGDVQSIKSGSGTVQANNVGSIDTGSGSVTCGDVSGNIDTGSGSVNCGSVGGSIDTGSGSVIHR